MTPKLYALSGDGGAFFSSGFISWAQSMRSICEVDIRYDSGRDTVNISADMLSQPEARRLALVGYSLGGNGTAWVADSMFKSAPKRFIDLLVAVDPTKNGPPLSNYPIRSNVKRAMLFKQVSLLSPFNWFFGRGEIVSAPGGPNIGITELHADHVWLQYSRSWQGPTEIAIQALR